jgi:hypothetical protein
MITVRPSQGAAGAVTVENGSWPVIDQVFFLLEYANRFLEKPGC